MLCRLLLKVQKTPAMTSFFVRLTQMSHDLAEAAGRNSTIQSITLSDEAWWHIAKEIQNTTSYNVRVEWSPDRLRDDDDHIIFYANATRIILRREPRSGAIKSRDID